MRIAKSFLFVTLWACALSMGQEFRNYPGSKPDEKLGQQTASRGAKFEVYTTPDSYEKVYAFYKSQYKEHPTPFPEQVLPSGKKVQWSFFILDGGKDLAHSKLWVKVQRPVILTVDDDSADFKGIRDVTAIQVVRAK